MSHSPTSVHDGYWGWLLIPIAAYVVAHLALFSFDIQNPDALLAGDRASERIALIEQILSVHPESLSTLVLQAGPPGDYAVHAALYQAAGAPLTIMTQMLAGLVTLLLTLSLALELGASHRAAAAGGLLLVVMPGAIMNPHVLVTESFFTGAFVLGVFTMVLALKHGRPRWIWLGALAWAVATFIRPQGVLFMPIGAALIAWHRPDLRYHAITATSLGLLLSPGIWIFWRYGHTGDLGLGPFSADLGINLRIRADRIMALLGSEWSITARAEQPRYSVPMFLDLVIKYPEATARTYLSDLVNFMLNPGSNALGGHYLGLFKTPNDPHYWKLLLDKHGVTAVARDIMLRSSLQVTMFVLFAAVQALALTGLLFGLFVRPRRPVELERTIQLVIVLTLVATVVVFLSGLVRWAHRSPLEPVAALCLALLLSRKATHSSI